MPSARVFLRGLFQATVWSHFAVKDVPDRFEPLYKMVLPIKYTVVALYGFYSIGYPLSSIDYTFGTIYGDLWSFSLMIAGFAAIVGIVFYGKLIWLEIVAICSIVALLMWYILCLFLAAIQGFESFRILSLLLVILIMPILAWRMWDMVRKLRPPAHVS